MYIILLYSYKRLGNFNRHLLMRDEKNTFYSNKKLFATFLNIIHVIVGAKPFVNVQPHR